VHDWGKNISIYNKNKIKHEIIDDDGKEMSEGVNKGMIRISETEEVKS